jgi:hypothetical protein
MQKGLFTFETHPPFTPRFDSQEGAYLRIVRIEVITFQDVLIQSILGFIGLDAHAAQRGVRHVRLEKS